MLSSADRDDKNKNKGSLPGDMLVPSLKRPASTSTPVTDSSDEGSSPTSTSSHTSTPPSNTPSPAIISNMPPPWTPPTLESLNKMVEQANNKKIDFSKILFVVAQHALNTTASLIEALIKLGADKKNIYLVGKSYSNNPTVIKWLKENTHYTKTSAQEDLGKFKLCYQNDVNALWRSVLKRISSYKKALAKKENKNLFDYFNGVIVLDDGGYLLQATPSEIKETFKGRIVGIEQTSSGVSAAEVLKFPSVMVANSAVKTKIEPLMVATVIGKKIEEKLALLATHPFPTPLTTNSPPGSPHSTSSSNSSKEEEELDFDSNSGRDEETHSGSSDSSNEDDISIEITTPLSIRSSSNRSSGSGISTPPTPILSETPKLSETEGLIVPPESEGTAEQHLYGASPPSSPSFDEEEFEEFKKTLANKNKLIIGIAGFGSIGKAVLQQLIQQGYRKFIIYDKDQHRREEGCKHGLSGITVRATADFSDVVGNCNVIVGCTGTDITQDKLSSFQVMGSPKVLISCSSGDVEFLSLLTYLESTHERRQAPSNVSADLIYKNGFSSHVIIAHGGLPFNFDNSERSVAECDIELIRGILFQSVLQAHSILKSSLRNPGCVPVQSYKLDPERQMLALKLWIEFGKPSSPQYYESFLQACHNEAGYIDRNSAGETFIPLLTSTKSTSPSATRTSTMNGAGATTSNLGVFNTKNLSPSKIAAGQSPKVMSGNS